MQTVTLEQLNKALGIITSDPAEALLEARRRKPVESVALEGNGPANIISLARRAAEATASREEVQEALAQIEMQALMTMEYMRQCRAFLAPRWHEILRKEDEKHATD